jgi:segregation and condensation protein B
MDISSLIPHIEALIFASDKPLAPEELTELLNNAFGFMEDKLEVEQVTAALEGIVEKYNSEFYPFEVRQSGGGWQFLTKKSFHKTVAQLNGEKFLKRLSAAALETLAIIAYKQPITKGEIESIRGVSSDYSVQKLLEKDLIIISGRNEKLPGHPLVYATSKSFMDYFGINSPEDLPKIKEVLAEQAVVPTTIHHTDGEEPSALMVTDTGELIDPLVDETPYVNGEDVAEFDIDETDEVNEGKARLFIQGEVERDVAEEIQEAAMEEESEEIEESMEQLGEEEGRNDVGGDEAANEEESGDMDDSEDDSEDEDENGENKKEDL